MAGTRQVIKIACCVPILFLADSIFGTATLVAVLLTQVIASKYIEIILDSAGLSLLLKYDE